LTNGAGRLDVEQIRGWMTLSEISSGYGIPLEELYRRAKIPTQVAAETRLNQVAKNYQIEFEAETVRDVVRNFLATPRGSDRAGREAAKPASPQSEKSAAVTKGQEPEIKGYMTLNEVALKTGVPKEWLIRRLGLPANVDPRKPLREWMHDAGMSIQDVRQIVDDYRAGKR